MSNYRDDTNEIAVASSGTWMGVKFITESTAFAASVLLTTIGVLHTDSAVASDQVVEAAGHVLASTATASDSYSDHLHARVLVVDGGRMSDEVRERLRVLSIETVTASDATTGRLRVLTVEQATISDTVIASRHSLELVTEAARVSDSTWQPARAVLTDQAVASSAAPGVLHARVLLTDQVNAADEVFDAHRSNVAVIVDSARATSEVIDHLHARTLVVETVLVADEVPGSALFDDAGQAWTANVDSWAMSRYAPYTFESLAVIDGVLYGMRSDGVYALDGGEDVIAATVTTGKVDLGKGALVHPQSAYLEYELDGTAELDVTTTQSGAAETYTYGLPPKLAGELTNGRFVFGRGLRGRHFTFALRMTGTHGYINDLSVTTAQTKRRV